MTKTEILENIAYLVESTEPCTDCKYAEKSEDEYPCCGCLFTADSRFEEEENS